MAETKGWTAPGWEGVRDAFQNNLDNNNEVGAAFSAYHRGQKMVDLWGGIADKDTGRAWEEDTLELVFSTTKGATAIVANQLAQEGRLDVDAPVTDYWPEFEANGKKDIPVSYLLSHQAGLAWIDDEMTLDEVLQWEPVIRALEKQAPAWEPGSQHGYHATTYGWLVGEVCKRITGTSLGTAFRKQVGDPLDLDFWIGLPESEIPRVAKLISMLPPGARMDGTTESGEPDPMMELMVQFMGPDTMLGKALTAPGGAFTDFENFNLPEVWMAEIPAANGVGDARSLARMYGACVSDVDGIRLLSPDQIKAATTQQTEGPNVVLMNMEIHFGLGFMLNTGLIGMVGLGGPNSFGHFGAGGSVGWADPDAEMGFGYIMNRMDIGMAGDTRSFDLINACYKAIG